MCKGLMALALALLMGVWLPWQPPIWGYGLWAFLGLLLWRRRIQWAVCLWLMLAGHIYVSHWVAAAQAHRVPLSMVGTVQPLTVRVQTVLPTHFGGQQLRVKVLALEGGADQGWQPRHLSLRDASAQDWALGSVWQISVVLNAPVGRLNPAGFEAGHMAVVQGLDGGGRILPQPRQFVRQQHDVASMGARLRAKAQARVERLGVGHERGAALVSALSLGQRQNLTPELWQAFRVTGLNHLVSISGLHVTLVAGFVAFWAQFGLRLWAHPRGNSRLYLGVVSVLAALFYAGLSGFAIPTQRSVWMLVVALLLLQLRFYVTVWVVWWAAFCLVLAHHPGAALSIGFWLSFLLVAALLGVSSGRRRLRSVSWGLSLLRLQWVATIASLVPVAYFFGEVPSISFLVNLLAIPWTTLVLLPLALLGQVLPIDAVLRWAIILSDVSLQQLLRLVPWAWTWMLPQLPWLLWVAAGLGTVLWLLPRGLPVRSMATLCWALPLAYQPPPPPLGTLRVTVWDIGQGLSVLLQTRHQNMLYDTGPEASGQTVLQNLSAMGVRQLDEMILSHNDADHDAGWRPLHQALRPRRLWAGVPAAYAPTLAQHCTAGGAWVVDEVYFEWLTPDVGARSNDRSCVLRVIAGRQAILLTGDLEIKGEGYLAQHYGADLFSQVLILGHHGSKTSTTEVFLRQVAPVVGIASSGFANRYGHPHAEVVSRLQRHEVRLYRTDLSGAIRLTLGHDLVVQPLVTTQRWWRLKPVSFSETAPN